MLTTTVYSSGGSNNLASQPKRPQTVPNFSQLSKEATFKPINRELTQINEQIRRDNVKAVCLENNRTMEKSDSHIFFAKRDDPLTNLREVLRTLSNAEAFKYMKQCRYIVARLKKCWVEVNEEIKSLARNKEYLESAIDHIRKDLVINKEIVDSRVYRVISEPVIKI